MNDASKYEFFAGNDPQGNPVWTSDFQKIKPLAEWQDHMGCVTMTYNPGLKKYLMCVTDGGNTVSRYNTYVLESDRITGPWKLVSHMSNFGEQAYFVNLPSKFISKDDGRSLWLCYAANFSSGWGGTTFKAQPPGSRYGMCLQEIRLLKPGEDASPDLLHSPANIARNAEVTVSSTHTDYSANGAVDGVVGGYPDQIEHEWASRGERDTAMIRLSWSTPQTIDCVQLFDRPNDLDQVTSGMLIFSDGSTISTGALPDNARQGLDISFAPKTVQWLIFAVNRTKPGTLNIGLSEIAVFSTQP
jgi:hypothetical protein